MAPTLYEGTCKIRVLSSDHLRLASFAWPRSPFVNLFEISRRMKFRLSQLMPQSCLGTCYMRSTQDSR